MPGEVMMKEKVWELVKKGAQLQERKNGKIKIKTSFYGPKLFVVSLYNHTKKKER